MNRLLKWICVILPVVLAIRFGFHPVRFLLKMGGAASIMSHENAAKLSPENEQVLLAYEKECLAQNMSPIELHYALAFKVKELSALDVSTPRIDNGVTKRTNSAFLFIKPHANTAATQEKVQTTLREKGINILREGEFTGEEIDKDMLIDQHYYAIASKATILKPDQIPVPEDKFLEFFGVSWKDVLEQGLAYNAVDAGKFLEVDIPTLNEAWLKCKMIKFGGGFYCGRIEMEGKTPIYVFNAFFMTMRSKFVAPGTSIHYYVVEFNPEELSWADFRGNVLGPTDPHKAPVGSLRENIKSNWETYGLKYEPTVGDNCVHASASPFEGLAERMNWLKIKPEDDTFGKRVMQEAGISADTIRAWSVDPQVGGKSIFDQLEDTDADACLEIMKKLNENNK